MSRIGDLPGDILVLGELFDAIGGRRGIGAAIVRRFADPMLVRQFTAEPSSDRSSRTISVAACLIGFCASEANIPRR